MLKKFVEVNAEASPSPNPYAVRTYMGDNVVTEWKVESCPPRERVCQKKPPNSTISHVLTIEDELRRIHQKAEESRFIRPFKKRCDLYDEHTMCIVPQRRPGELKVHAEMRERLLMANMDTGLVEHDARMDKTCPKDLVVLNSPMAMDDEEEEEDGEGEEEDTAVKPQQATPECSSDMIIIPDKRMLELKRPKSRIYINETEVGPLEELPFPSYNPRVIQENLEGENLRSYDIIEGCSPQDLWTWNAGLQRREMDLDQEFIAAALPKFDTDLKLTVYNIPKQMEKTFAAEIVFGGRNIYPEPKKEAFRQSYYNRPSEIAAIIIAFVETYNLTPDFWTAATMDNILKRGVKLTKKSINYNYKSEENDFDILPQVEERLAAVSIKIHFSGLFKNEPNVYKALSLYFSKYDACIFTSRGTFLLIWKRCSNSYFIFDPNGRNEQCKRDFVNGKCSLMAARFTEHLVHLLLTFTDLLPEDEFSIYEITLTQFGKLKEAVIGKSKGYAYHKLWAVVNENFAVKTAGNGGIQQPISGSEKNASIVVSLIAIIYSEFELAKVWRPMTVDDIIRYGVAYYKTLRKKFRLDGKRWKNKKPELNVVDLPEMFLMGAFKATVRKFPFLITGHVTDCKSYLESQLTQALQRLFEKPEWPAALLQIDNSVLGIWRDREFFYVFDPFRRNRVGLVVDPDDYRIKGLAVLQLHTTFDSFVRVLYENALKMRRGGKFFIHGIRTGCIRPLQVVEQQTNKFPALQMGLPEFTDEAQQAELEQKKSIESIPEEERFPTRSEREMVEDLILGIINSIIKDFPEAPFARPDLYRQAQRVLLRTDKENLRALRLKIKRGYELGEEEDQGDLKRVLTLEEELLLKSNYMTLHDGAYIIMGTTKLPELDAEMTKLGGILAALVALAVSAKYKVSTWNADLVEFCLESVNKFNEDYQNYELILSCLLNKKLPDIAVGESNFSLVITDVFKSSTSSSLRQDLLELLINNNRVLVVCQHFSCAIFRRWNLLYMFIGFPCNAIGYRKGSPAPACMMRFIELDSLIRRIECGCNPQGCTVMNYIVAAIKMVDNGISGRFRRGPKSDEDAEFNAESQRKQKLREQRLEKMRYIDEELKKENKRIQDFLDAKQAREDRKMGKPEYIDLGLDEGMGEGEFDMEMGMEEEEGEGEEEVELKHKPGKVLPKEIRKAYKPRPILYGYRMREKDCNFKIQGSMNLEDREGGSFKEIKPCYFASALAILSCSLRPLNRWNSYRVDRVISHAKAIATRVCDLESIFERVVRHITIDEYEFDIWIRILEPVGMWTPEPKPQKISPEAGLTIFKKKLQKTLANRKYMMLFTPNGCFALYHDEFYHLFDPYATMDKPGEEEEEDADGDNEGEGDGKKKKKKCPPGPKRYPERNTASWVLFADVDTMLKYVDDRCAQADWKEANQYMFYVVDVLSYKKAAPNARILQLLTDLSVPMTCSNRSYGRPEYEICATNESLGWLELENCLPVWSRMNRRNTAGKYRNLPLSKLKKYDIEIEGRLWSLWGNLHPEAPVFEDVLRGRQYLGIYVIACCAASVYNLMDWSAQLLDTLVVSGTKYFQESVEQITKEDYEFSLENLNIDCALETINFVVHIEHVCYGKLYRIPTFNRMNLSEALIYFFSHYQYGIVMVRKRALAIGFCPGHDGGYFMYDCQEKDQPLFPKQQGASYLLRTRHLQVLLYCIVVTLNVPFYNIDFSIHKVEMLREGATVEDDEEEGGGEE